MQLNDLKQARTVLFDRERLTIEDIADIARGRASVALSTDPAFRAAIARGADFLDRLLREDGVIYGVTTGYGDSCTVTVPPELVAELPHHLYTYHGCGLGACLDPAQTRAVLAARLASLSKGYSGVSVGLLEQIARLLDAGLLPVIPSEGSVGASGDLTPLSYLAAVLCGEREVWRDGVQVPAAEALRDAGIAPLRLRPKEGLAIMNGTAVMTALACLAWERAAYLVKLTTRITAMASFALDGNAHHFDETLFSVKPHAGMQGVAGWLRADLAAGEAERNGKRLQDRYSIRCAPHVIGVLADALPFFRNAIENELNSANDNPIIDAENERVLHGGHFYGGHIAFAMDSMKNTVANLADLLDRQMALLVDSRYNSGLPANLSGMEGPRAAINHGPESAADQRVGMDGGSIETDHARFGLFPFDRVPQPGQGQHGYHRRARLPARAGVDRTGGGGAADRRAPGRVAALPGEWRRGAGRTASHDGRARNGHRSRAGRPPPRPGTQAADRAHPRPGLEPVCVKRKRPAAGRPRWRCRCSSSISTPC